MFKRVVWTGVGYGLGLGSSVLVQRKVKRAVERYTPESVRVEAAERSKNTAAKIKDLTSDVRSVVQKVRKAGDDVDLRTPTHGAPRRSRGGPYRHR